MIKQCMVLVELVDLKGRSRINDTTAQQEGGQCQIQSFIQY